jgi:hypothetical protein
VHTGKCLAGFWSTAMAAKIASGRHPYATTAVNRACLCLAFSSELERRGYDRRAFVASRALVDAPTCHDVASSQGNPDLICSIRSFRRCLNTT